MATYIPGVTDIFPQPSLFTPDFSLIDKMLQRRQSMYEQGFAQVNSKYSLVDREVTNPVNQEVKARFLTDARNNLKNLSAMDLSQQENVDAAIDVFSPFIKNTNVIGDQALTEHWKRQISLGENYRLKDGGKEFSEDNINYIRMQQQAFAGDDPNSWKSYYQSKRSYNPYYDYHKEYTEAMKNFKPSTYEVDKIKGLYKITEKDESAKEADIKRYLNATLSDKAKRQMAIEGVVRYGSDVNGLASRYLENAPRDTYINNLNIQQANKQLALITDPTQKAMLQATIDQYKEENEDIQRNVDNIKKGDLSFIKANSEGLASGLYFNDVISKLSKGFSYDKVTKKISADAVGVALMREDRQDSRQLKGFAHAEEMQRRGFQYRAELEVFKKNLDKKIAMNDYSIENVPQGEDQGETVTRTMDAYKKQIGEIASVKNDLMMETKQHVLSLARRKNPNLTINDIDQNFIENWLKTGGPNGKPIPQTDLYYKNVQQLRKYDELKNIYNNELSKFEEIAFSKLTEKEKQYVTGVRNKIQRMPDIVLSDGSKISPIALEEGIKKGTIEYTPGKRGFWDVGAPQFAKVKIGNRTYTVDRSIGANVNLLNAYEEINNLQRSSSYKKFKSNLQNAYSEVGGSSDLFGKRARYYDQGDVDKYLNSIIGNLFPLYTVQQQGVGTTTDNQGDVYYKLYTKGKNAASLGKSELEEVAEQLTAKGYGNRVSVVGTEGTGYELQIKGLDNSVTRAWKSFNSAETLAATSAGSWSGNTEYETSPFTTSNSETQFTITKSNNLFYLNIVGLDDPYPSTFKNPSDAVVTAKLLTANNNARLNAYLRAISAGGQ